MNETQEAYLDQFLSKLCRAQRAVTRSEERGNVEGTAGLTVCRDAIHTQIIEFVKEQVKIHPRQLGAVDRLLIDLCEAQEGERCDIATRIKGYVGGMPSR